MLGAIALCLWQTFTTLPPFLQSVASFVGIIIIIHAIEGMVAALIVLRYRLLPQDSQTVAAPSLLTEHLPKNTLLAVIKGGLYVFFVGTAGLSEIVQASKAKRSKTA